MSEPITVSQLIQRLSQFDPNALVMVECQDPYYSGPLAESEVQPGVAFKIGPYGDDIPLGRRDIRSWITRADKADPPSVPISLIRPCIRIMC